mgnify:CR=1 FL=1
MFLKEEEHEQKRNNETHINKWKDGQDMEGNSNS